VAFAASSFTESSPCPIAQLMFTVRAANRAILPVLWRTPYFLRVFQRAAIAKVGIEVGGYVHSEGFIPSPTAGGVLSSLTLWVI
jgi:hypothetical protein